MKLSSFQVGPYRNVLDSGSISVHPSVTVLVGKNESGKTNLLHALHALNPANGDRDFPRLDYPRWLQKSHERSGRFSQAKPIQVVFDLTDDDVQEAAGLFGENVLTAEKLSAYRTYRSESFVLCPPACDVSTALNHLFRDLPVAVSEGSSDIGALREQLQRDAQARDETGNQTEQAVAAGQALKRLQTAYGKFDSVSEAITDFVSKRVPRFFYFDEYAELSGTTDTGPLVQSLRSNEDSGLNSRQRTALSLLRMGFADSEIIADDYDARKAELQAVSSELTQKVLAYWKQNQHLRLMIDINPVVEQTHPSIVRRDLKLDVMDDRHYFTNSLDARSNGFRWFVSFISAFTEFEEDSNVIVLLDEPGLNLHARAQADFLRFVNEKVSSSHQVVFTTHSPFMVDPARLERVRIVEDTGPDTGATVTTTDNASNDRDTLFPLQAALGYDIAQNLFVGPDNLVVEGLSDFNYLTILSDHLASVSRAHLDERWRVLPAGGATNIPTFVALVGPSLDVTVLVDGAAATSQKIRNLMKRGLLHNKRLLTPNAATTTKDADIEDLFTDEDYLKLYNPDRDTNLKPSDLQGTDRLTKRIERAAGKFDHNKPARYLLHNRNTLLSQLSETTLDRFEKLIVAINNTLSVS